MITQQLIASIMSSKSDVDADYVYAKLTEVENITKGIRSANKEIEAECKKHETIIKEIKLKITTLQKQCNHWSKTYHPDPSGNSDSFYECEICGKYL